MARRGRKKQSEAITNRKGGKRKGAGRPKSISTIEKERDVKSVALNQPHRRGAPLEWLASPVGRILASSSHLLAKTSANALHDSANRFAEAYSKWQSVVGAPRPFANSSAIGDADITPDRAERFRRQWADAWRALRQSGEMREKAVFAVIIDPQAEDWQPPHWVVYACIDGLKALANHFGIDFSEEDKEARRDAA